MRIKFTFTVLFLYMSLTGFAQDNGLGKLLPENCPDNYLGQHSDRSNKKYGTGILQLKNGGIYIGDFAQNKYNGRGILMMPDDKSISNSPAASVYVGGWEKGKKKGLGICYAPNGDILYRGNFENDKPTDPYPQTNPDMSKYFTMMETNDGYYIGEVTNGSPDGFGLCIQESDGAYWVGLHKNGMRSGMSIFFYGPDSWTVGKYNREGAFEVISNSSNQIEREKRIETINRQIWSNFAASMDQFANTLTAISEMHTPSTSNQVGYDSSNDYDSGSKTPSGSKKSGNSKNLKKGNDCGTAWMSDSNVYSDYESQLIKDNNMSESDIRDVKAKMKAIRIKWEKRGCPFTKSPHE